MEVRGPIEAPMAFACPMSLSSFRGWKSAAPLKQRPRVLAVDGSRKFPRMEVRGPIEARGSSTLDQWTAHVSADGSPRPH